MTYMQKVIKVSAATYASVTKVRDDLSRVRQRQVTYAETIEELVRNWQSTADLVTDALSKAAR